MSKSANVLKEFGQISSSNEKSSVQITVWQVVPVINGGSVNISNSYVMLTGTGTVNSFTINFPSTPLDGQTLSLYCQSGLTITSPTYNNTFGGSTPLYNNIGELFIFSSALNKWVLIASS
jgi:hypothetical protein